MPTPPNISTHIGTATFILTVPDATMSTMAASGPTALATSLAPCEKATEQELITTRGAKTPSTRASWSLSGRPSLPLSARWTSNRDMPPATRPSNMAKRIARGPVSQSATDETCFSPL